uniref:LAGLIDADG_2 domain-containing protein n=1 Tax=Panagrellus redivivus TaxID=6233 RepID=A0A7E4VPF3_PANRE
MHIAVETSTLLIQYYGNKIPPNNLIHNPKKFINWLGKLEVHGSFTLNYHEKYLCKNIRNRNLAEVKEKVKSAGFVETYEENKFVMVRTFHSAKLVYNVVLDFLAK